MSESQDKRTWWLQLIGWLLFVVCAFIFIAASYLNGDVLTLIGSLVFLAACIFFLIPMFSRQRKRE